MQRPPDSSTPTNALRNTPGLHGLGLKADTSVPAPSSLKQQVLPNGKMPSVIPVQLERRPMQDALRRVGSQDETLTVPKRSDSLKNRKSRRIRPASLEKTVLEEGKEGRPDSSSGELPFTPRDLDRFPHRGYTPQLPFSFDKSIDDRIPHESHMLHLDTLPEQEQPTALLSRPQLDRANTSYHTAQHSLSDYAEESSPSNSSHSKNTSISMVPSHRSSPLRMQFDGHGQSADRDSDPFSNSATVGTRPTISVNAPEPLGQDWTVRKPSGISPRLTRLPVLSSTAMSNDSSATARIPSWDMQREVDDGSPTSRNISYTRHSTNRSFIASQEEESTLKTIMEDLREELRAVSIELAASIQREMDLEDEVDRLKVERPSSRDEPNRRTSDYYSESTGSSIRFPLAESETKIQGLEKMRRKAEQEKAQMRHSMAQKLQEDLVRRKTLELHCQTLEEQLSSRQSLESSRESISEKARELEASLNDTRRRLNEERQIKQSVEDLLASLREDAEKQRNERDNLRDEVVPRLRARVEGLEQEALETQTLAYDNSRMQQEIEALRTENQTLVNARKLQIDLQSARASYEANEPMSPKSPPLGVFRSRSVIGNKGARPKRFSFSSGNDAAEVSMQEEPSDSLKDVEDQRDALHRTLKSLIYRQNYMIQQHAKQVRTLESERDIAQNGTPRRKAFNAEVQDLRNEVEHLRRRADDAMEQKWQCEKGLSGLKLDLDRAEQETASLSSILREQGGSIQTPRKSLPADNLGQAYTDLRLAHADSFASLQGVSEDDVEVLNTAEKRMAPLFSAIEAQLESNTGLRRRLSLAVERRMQEQQASTEKITKLQHALKAAEDNVIAAQGATDETLVQQEELVKDLTEMKQHMNRRGIVRKETSALQRASTAPLPRTGSILSRTERSPRVPDVEWKPALRRRPTSVLEQGKSQELEKRVRLLEEEAGRAEREIKNVVERLSLAQMEVAEMQAERDEASRRTRKLQRDILEERQRLRGLATK